MTSASYQKHKNLSVANLYKIYKSVKQDLQILVSVSCWGSMDFGKHIPSDQKAAPSIEFPTIFPSLNIGMWLVSTDYKSLPLHET
jgi:hypothetical protein